MNRPADPNQKPEQRARDAIDLMLAQAGWKVQSKNRIDFSAGPGIAVREYQTDIGPADYVLFVDKTPVGVIEAKPDDWGQKLTTVEDQSGGYAAAKLKWLNNKEPLPFVYESTGVLTRFTDARDPRPRSREVFNFARPETMQEWLSQPASLRSRIQRLPPLDPHGLRACQIKAIEGLEDSFRDDRPRALIQMATGSGKTYTAITSIYRLLKHADARRVLFLVDTRNLGEQAEQEFMAYVPNDDNRKFTELYNVQRLKSSKVCAVLPHPLAREGSTPRCIPRPGASPVDQTRVFHSLDPLTGCFGSGFDQGGRLRLSLRTPIDHGAHAAPWTRRQGFPHPCNHGEYRSNLGHAQLEVEAPPERRAMHRNERS